ncbi:leucine-rich repeat receptor protein kinase MSP1-like protein [Tanacetum coccineum]
MLSGELLAEICQDNALGMLWLSDNDFTSTIDSTFRTCSILTDLVISENNLYGELPSYLGELQLITLELSKNRLSGTIPPQLWESKTLMEISLSGNLLEGRIPASIANATTLQRSPYTKRDLISIQKVPSTRLRVCPTLRDDLISPTTTLWAQFPSYQELHHYNTSNVVKNKLNGTIPYKISGLYNLTSLNLLFNLLSGPTLPRFFSMKNL